MKKINCFSLKKILLSILAPIVLGTAVVGGTLMGDTAKAFSDNPANAETTIKTPLYNFDEYHYDEKALDALAAAILGSGKTLDDLIAYVKGTAGEYGKPVESKTITLQYGRYLYTSTTGYYPLIWMPVYMSTTTDSKHDAVLTLYLSTVNASMSNNEYSSFTPYGQNTTSVSSRTPANMYGTSYIRAVTLGNGGTYGTYSNNTTSTTTAARPTEFNKYSDFLEYQYETGTGSDKVTGVRTGYLYDDIVTPSQLAWQSYESYKTEIGDTGKIYEGGPETAITPGEGTGTLYNTSGWEKYCWPNDAYGTPDDGVYYEANYFDYGNGTASKKDGYDTWKNDKVWLPSLTEVGTGDTGSLNGLWELNKSQRSMFAGSGSMAAKPTAWLRTANTAYSDGTNNYSTSHIFVVEHDGSIGFRRLDYEYATTTAVRPAIHLNLSAAKEKIKPPVNLPDTITATYNGAEHRIEAGNVTLTEEQSSWFVPGQMSVRFATDANFTKIARPINAGEYYLEVRISSSLYFVNPDPDDPLKKTVKFVIEKAKVGVKWTVENNLPTGIEYSPGTTFYQRDITADNIPKLGIKYQATNNGKYYYDFDDLMRGGYLAEAYIIDDDLYNYNYQLSDELGEDITLNNAFDVGRKIIEMPYITGAGEGVPDAQNKDILTYTMSYKGDQYIQIENVSKYLLVSVTPKSGGTIECLNDTQFVTVNNVRKEFPIVSAAGTLTYKLTDVDYYTFTFEFPDSIYYTWKGTYDFNTTGKDDGAITTPDYLAIDLQQGLVDAEFVGLPSEWISIAIQMFTVELRGIYGKIDDTELPIEVQYMNERTGDSTTVPSNNGVYTLSNLAEGTYTLYVGFVKNDVYDKLYRFPSGYVSYRFKVLPTISEFNDNLVKWQYTHDGVTHAAGGYLDHDREESAFEFDYDGKDFVFSLTTNEDTLRDIYYVKAIYSGDKFVSDAGMHSITVEIKGYYKNVQVTEKSYTLYFHINPAKYDLSGLEWDYDPDAPFTFDGVDHKVRVTPESLAQLPGLTIDYSTNGNRITAGNYETTASFVISAGFANNYVLPDATNENSYDGTFAFTCSWEIKKAKLTVEWFTPEENSSDLYFAPILKKNGEFVTYSFEHKLSNGNWEAATLLVAEGAAETYRVNAVLRPEFVNNYELENNVPCEFQVESGKRAVTVHFEFDGQVCSDGAQFTYTGNPVELELKVDTDGLAATYEFKYYKLGTGNTRELLSSAPFDVGSYVAVVTAQYSTDSYLSSECATEVAFEIIKADYDVNEIWWLYQHGDTTIAAKYDHIQGKFVNDYGEEVVFSFEYDGTAHTLTVECQQQFGDPDDKIEVLRLQGNTGINADVYTAAVDFTFNSDRYNDPHNIFPRLLQWEITKQKIDYNNVRWGYINADNEEKDFDFDEDTFRYTRNENGPVGVTVALIGLPKGVQSLMTYTTKSLSSLNDVAAPGNTRSAIGDYLTSFTISGTWTDPQGNYEDFDASTFPLSIPASQTWSIVKRDLTKIDYDNSWTTFDDRVHDIIELCKIPYDELNYLKVEITFIDKSYAVFSDYIGYEGVTNALYHAGTYDIKIYERQTTYSGGVEVEELVVWDVLSLVIDKAELAITWDQNGAYPIARASSVFATDMIVTVYTRENGAEVPLAYVKSSSGDETFYATVKIADDYVNDINIKMSSSQPEKVSFTYSPFTPTANVTQLELPELEVTEMKYTGSSLTFTIKGWETTYQRFLYISGGSLTQTDIGEYDVILRFYKEADAYWKNATQSSGEYNRDAVTLTFTILPPTEWAIDGPTLENDFIEYTGEEIEFKIVNWVALSKYVTYEVFYKGESLGDNLKVKHAGIYTIVFSFPKNSIGYWKDKPDDPYGPRTLQFTVYDPNSADTEILYPEFISSTAEYNGSEIQFKVKNWDTYYSAFLVISGSGVTIKNGVISATEIGTYRITFTFKDGVSNTFEGGKTTYYIDISITPPEGETDDPIAIQKPQMGVTEQDWTGNALEFSITSWVSIYGKYLVISSDNPSLTINNLQGTIKVTDIGVYTITISFKEGANAYWSGTNNSTASFDITFEVKGPDDPTLAVPPSLKTDKKQYNGKDQTFELSNFDSTKCEIVGGENALIGKAVGDYSVTIKLKDGLTWLDGTTDDIVLHFSIVKAQIGSVDVGSDGKIVVTDSNGNPIDFDLSDLVDVEYYDENGNKVNFEDLVPGQSYSVKLIVKDDSAFDGAIENGSSIRDYISDRNEKDKDNGGFVINNYQPSNNGENGDGRESGGFNPLWWIAIGGGILLFVIILIIIIVLATRNNNGGGYDDGYGYDDYGDYDDDDYDDDDDDDDYDDYDDYDY